MATQAGQLTADSQLQATSAATEQAQATPPVQAASQIQSTAQAQPPATQAQSAAQTQPTAQVQPTTTQAQSAAQIQPVTTQAQSTTQVQANQAETSPSPLTSLAQEIDAQASDDSFGRHLLSPEWGGSGGGARQPKPMPEAETIADQRLQRIYDSQQQVFAEIAANPNISTAVRDQRLQNIISNYQSLLLDNPDYLYGYILYGKFLRDVDQRELANMAFVKANSLNPDIPVVKQQIANYLSEEGEYALALPYYLAAIRLAPDTALYHYQLGTLLHTYRKEFLTQKQLTAPVLDKQLQDAFANAARLAPEDHVYAIRYAESFFDVANPDWQQALSLWDTLEQTAADARQKQIVLLQKARVLLALNQRGQAEQALTAVTDPGLQASKIVLLDQLASQSQEQAGKSQQNAAAAQSQKQSES